MIAERIVRDLTERRVERTDRSVSYGEEVFVVDNVFGIGMQRIEEKPLLLLSSTIAMA